MNQDLSQAFDTIWADLSGGASMVWLALVGVVLIVWDVFKNDDARIPWVAALALLAAGVLEALRLNEASTTAFFELVRVGGLASFINVVILGSSLVSVVLSAPYLQQIKHAYGEVYALILFATAGMLMLGTANNMVTVFVGLETMSIALYVLTGLVRHDEGAVESALKYFLLGAFSTGFFLFGIALIYGSTGTMYFTEMAAGYAVGDFKTLFWAGVGLFLIGFLFKVSAVPFHMWTPDVYQGAPTTLAGYMSTASKAAAFAALVLVLFHGIGHTTAQTEAGGNLRLVLALAALVTVVLGNLMALAQRNVKRMLAYSSIAHAGYVLIGLAAGTSAAYAGVVYYLLVYAIMNLGAFGVMAILEWDGREGRIQTLDSLSGIAYRHPLLGVLMGIFMFSLTGFPPFGGFFGKIAVFAPAVEVGLTWLAIVGVLTSVLSAGYYLRVVYVFWMRPESEGDPAVRKMSFSVSKLSAGVLTACAVVLTVVGFLPFVRNLTQSFFESGGLAGLF